MNRLRFAAVALIGSLVVTVLAWPVAADDTACSLATASFTDSMLNAPRGEDTDFFVTTGGVPNVVFLLDTSGSMVRLPPDGASLTWGSFESPLASGNGAGFGCTNEKANTLKFSSACGTTTLDTTPTSYSSTIDFAAAMDVDGKYCPYLDQAGKPMKTDRPGYDPDFYPTFFTRDSVYHDAILSPDASLDGWDDSSTSPVATAVATFCNSRSTVDKQTSCTSCMASKGYWFNGDYYPRTASSLPCSNTNDCARVRAGTCLKDSNLQVYDGPKDNTAHCRVPHVYFSGNFLNFYPPKFILARKVVKDVLGGVKLFRLGLYTFSSSGDGANEISGLNPPCNQIGSPSSFYNNRNSVKNAINNPLKVGFSGGTPLAESLLDIGHKYTTQTLPWFDGTTYARTKFEDGTSNNRSVCYACQKSSVLVVTDGIPSQDGNIPGVSGWSAMTQAIADKQGTSYAGMASYNITDIGSTDCPTCNTADEAADTTIANGTCGGQQGTGACSDAGNPIQSYLPKVAWYLHNMDLRADSETDVGGSKMTGKQSLDVYTIGLGTTTTAAQILRHTADAGGGLYNGGSDSDAVASGKELREAIDKSLEEVNTRSVAFGSASLSTLQAAASQSVLVPRFEPSRKAHWNGHLYAFDLWSEFTGGCAIPATGASGPANLDMDCDGKCTSVFLREKGTVTAGVYSPGAFITEDSSGAFVKNDPPNRAACGTGNRCGTNCAKASTAPATPFWDAGDLLSPVDAAGTAKTGGFKAWNQRKIYTVIDDIAPFGQITSADTLVQVADDDATVQKLLPYLNLGAKPKGGAARCATIAKKLKSAGNPLGTTIEADLGSSLYLNCGKVVVQYLLGADVFNERRCSGYPTTYCTRPYQLGDVFHSSPVEVWPPLPSDGVLCVRGMHSQCLPSLFSSSIPAPSADGYTSAYDDYQRHARYKHRNKFSLVGANDGMVHAILTGVWHAGADDPRTPQKEDRAPYEGYHDVGTGEEIWGFIPPDLLAKLALLTDTTHHYFVDGTAMVRDVWIDGGTANGINKPTSVDGKRVGSEFHTVAVMGERRGGTKYFALDVTDAGNDLDGKPRFLWIYPQPDDPEQLAFGETYAEFVPIPPPIGPVRVDAGAPPCTSGSPFIDSTNQERCFSERWIVFLSGGFDPQYTKGRGVHMVEIGSGKEIFDFSQGAATAGTSCTASSDPRCHLNYPVAGTVGMVMWGKQTHLMNSAAQEGYFDTATFADTGGQIWVLRFSDPGRIDSSTGKVSNWWGARVFQQGKTATTPACGVDFCGGQPFFHITSNVPLGVNGLYRVVAGTGDRFNILDPAGGQCGPDNIRACIAKGCTVTLDDGVGGAGASYANALLKKHDYHATLPASCGSFDPAAWSRSETPVAGAACDASTSKVDELKIVCPPTLVCAESPPPTGEESSKRVQVDCTAGSCTYSQLASGSVIDMKALSDRLNWYYSIQVFEDSGARQIFTDQAGAIAYDAARLTDGDLVTINDHDKDPAKPLATADGRGWKYYFDHGEPTLPDTVAIGGVNHHIYRADERVASTTAVEAGCTFFNTLQVALPSEAIQATNECPANSPCKAGKKQLTYLYGLTPSTGDLCLMSNETGTLVRSQRTEAVVPPHIGKLVAYVASGQVSYGLTSVRTGQGGMNISLGEAQDLASQLQWLPVDKQTEACRHAPKSAPPTGCK